MCDRYAINLSPEAMENYVHLDAIDRLSGGKIKFAAGLDLDFGDVSAEFGVPLGAAVAAHGAALGFAPTDHAAEKLTLEIQEDHHSLCDGKYDCGRDQSAWRLRRSGDCRKW